MKTRFTEEELLEEFLSKETFNRFLREWAKSYRVLLALSYVDACKLEDLKFLLSVNKKLSARLKCEIDLKEEEKAKGDKPLAELFKTGRK